MELDARRRVRAAVQTRLTVGFSSRKVTRLQFASDATHLVSNKAVYAVGANDNAPREAVSVLRLNAHTSGRHLNPGHPLAEQNTVPVSELIVQNLQNHLSIQENHRISITTAIVVLDALPVSSLLSLDDKFRLSQRPIVESLEIIEDPHLVQHAASGCEVPDAGTNLRCDVIVGFEKDIVDVEAFEKDRQGQACDAATDDDDFEVIRSLWHVDPSASLCSVQVMLFQGKKGRRLQSERGPLHGHMRVI